VASVLWNFAETPPMMEALWNNGVVDAVLILLRSCVHELEKVALGFFMCFLEYDTNAHIATSYDKLLVSTIIAIAKKREKKDRKYTRI